MDVKICVVLLCLALAVSESSAQGSSRSGNCPMRSTIKTCSPRCNSDYDCGSNNKCCPNSCGSNSCTSPSAVNTGADGGYKGSSNNGDVYCEGKKCATGEKCAFEQSTKRNKCVRS